MKRGLWVMVAALLASLVGFWMTRSQGTAPAATVHSHADGSRLSELEWLRAEFSLSEDEFAKVSDLHQAYQPTCEALCEKISVARVRVRALVLAGESVSTELEAALHEEAALRADCQTAMLGHLYETAAALPPVKARAFLDAMLPGVLEMAVHPGVHGDS